MNETPERKAKDRAGSVGAFAAVWGVPLLAVIAGFLFDPAARTAIWTIALAWMGTACLMNARRCGRMHCRFTGPYYLALIVPAPLLGLGLISPGPYAWWILAAAIIFGGKIIWWTTEAAWGKFSAHE